MNNLSNEAARLQEGTELPDDLASAYSDLPGFDSVYRDHYRKLVGSLVLLGHSPFDAEEVVQEAFMRAFGGWARIRLGSNPAGYLYRASFRLAQRRLKRNNNETQGDITAKAIQLDGSPIRAEIREAVRKLAKRQREALILCLYAGYPSSEAGRILGIKASTVRVHLRAARQSLQVQLKE